MSEIKFIELNCQRCGGGLEEQSSDLYICTCCGKEWRQVTLYNFTDMLEACEEANRRQRLSDVTNLRRQLWKETHKQDVSNIEVKRLCKRITDYLPEDFYACFYLATCSNSKTELCDFLFAVNVTERLDDIPMMLDYLLNALKPEWAMGVSNFIEKIKAVNPSLYHSYRTRFEEECFKNNNLVFTAEYPRHVFVAYSSKDMPKVRELVSVLEAADITCFVAERNMRHGSGSVDNYDDLLHTAIDNCSVIVFVSSVNSRSIDCDAYEKELKYINQKRKNMPRVEYLIEDYKGKDVKPAEPIFKKFFDGHEYCLSAQDVAVRVTEIIMDGEPVPEPKPETPPHMPESMPEPEPESKPEPKKKAKSKPEPKPEPKPEKKSELVSEHTPRHMPESTSDSVPESKPEPVPDKKAKPEKKAKTNKVSESVLSQPEFSVDDLPVYGEIAVSSVESEKPKFDFRESILKNGAKAIKSDAARLALFCVLICAFTFIYGGTIVLEAMFGPFTNFRWLDIVLIGIVAVIFVAITIVYLKVIEDFRLLTQIVAYVLALVVAVLCLVAFVFGMNTVEKDGMTFEAYDDGYALTGYTGEATELEIPEKVNGFAVTLICSYAFKDSTTLESITIPDSVTTIYSCAFEGCTALADITIGSGVTSIGSGVFDDTAYYENSDNWEDHVLYIGNYLIEAEYGIESDYKIKDGTTVIADNAFFYRTALKSITIPDSVVTIGDFSFCFCTSLQNVTIPADVTSIGTWAFVNCRSLTSITVNTDNTVYKSINGNLYSYDGTILIQYAAGQGSTLFTVPGGVTTIGDAAFYYCTSLKSVIMPDSVTTIVNYAFSFCSSLINVTFSENVTFIGGQAFHYCSSLAGITIPESVTYLGSGAFTNCNSLTSVTFENTSGWYVSESSTATSGTDVDVTDSETAATYLTTDYCDYYWKRG